MSNNIPDALTFNTVGLLPVECVFNMDCNDLAEKIYEICASQISDVYKVTFHADKKSGLVGWYCWFPGNSDHFTDNSTQNTALRKGLKRYSDEFMNFAKKFGWCPADDDPEHGTDKVNIGAIIDKNGNREISKYTCIRLSLLPFLLVMFDGYGTEYQKQFHKNAPKIIITRKYKWAEGGGEKRNRLVGVELKKTLHNRFMSRENLVPSRAGRF